MTPQYTVRSADARDSVHEPARFVRTEADPCFADVVQLARRLCDTPIALLAAAGPDGSRLRAAAGLQARDAEDAYALCAPAAQASCLVEIVDLTHGPDADHRLVAGKPGLRALAGVGLLGSRGGCIGSLCVLDRRRRTLDSAQREALAALARMTVALIEARGASPRVADVAGTWSVPLAPIPVSQEALGDRYAVAIIELDSRSVAASAATAVMQQMQAVVADVIGPDDVLSRDGPHELLVVCAQADQAPATLDRLAASVAALPEHPRVLIGAATGRHQRDAMEDVFLAAEGALHQARAQRGSGVVFASGPRPAMNA